MTGAGPGTEQKDFESPKLEPQKSGLLGWLRQTDEKFLLLKSLSILGVVGTVIGAGIGSYFQYKTAQQEQNLAHYKEDFAAATSAFTDVATALQSAMRLQHALFIAFSAAVTENVYADENAFLTKSGRDLYKRYVDERLTLRKNIDVLARRVEIYIDWASDLRRDPSTATAGLDPLSSSSVLGAYDFDCDKHMPRQKVSELPLKDHPERPALRVDWNSAKHHVFSFFYCFERTHESIRAARQWASASEIDPQERAKLIPSPTDDVKKWQDDVDRLHGHIRNSLDNSVERQTAFNTLAMRRIEQIRLKYQNKGYLCHVTGFWCG